jgi:hypothetical protein
MANAKELLELSRSAIGEVELDRLLLDAVRRAIEPDHRRLSTSCQRPRTITSWSGRSLHFRRAGSPANLGRPSAIGPP